MNGVSHTPLPWIRKGTAIYAPGCIVAATHPMPKSDEEAPVEAANAAYILLACNNYGDVVYGLSQAIEQLKADYFPTPLDGRGALIRKLESIHAIATKEA